METQSGKFFHLFFYRDLLITWVYRTIRARYQQSVLGGLWAILVPVTQTLIFSVIFTYFVPINTGGIPYLVFSYTAMVPWTLFSSSITDMVDSLVSNINLVSKVYFPREILPISAQLARLFDFLIAFCLLLVIMMLYKMPFNFLSWLFLPIIIIIQVSFSLGIGFIGAALNVFYRDIRHIFTLGLQLWFYASPIIYPVSSVPPQFHTLYFLNPMAGVIEAYRSVILYHKVPDSNLLLSAGIACVILAIGYWLFKRVEYKFADVV